MALEVRKAAGAEAAAAAAGPPLASVALEVRNPYGPAPTATASSQAQASPQAPPQLAKAAKQDNEDIYDDLM